MIKKLFSFFPLQLLFEQLKDHILIILTWVPLFLFILNIYGKYLGIPSLFLLPEYMDKINPVAFFFTGLSIGSLVMAYHLATYVTLIHKFPFVVRMPKPFFQFSINNSLIPVLYISIYIVQSFYFQRVKELLPVSQVLLNLLSLLAGILLFIYFTFGFFLIFYRKIPQKIHEFKKNFLYKWIRKISENEQEKKATEAEKKLPQEEKTEYYFSSFFKVKRIDRSYVLDKDRFKSLLHQQHRNVFIFVVLLLAFIIARGMIRHNPYLIIPSGASFHVIFTVILLMTSIFYVAFKEWTFWIVSALVLWLSYSPPVIVSSYHNSAYGLNYDKNIRIDVNSHGDFKADSLKTINILNNWKKKNSHGKNKPKIVFICTSGGGMKLSLWTYYALSKIDYQLNGELLKHTFMITGASGGIFGAAYLRELYLEYLDGKIDSFYTEKLRKNLTSDILNSVFYSFSMSDWFFRLKKFELNGHYYYEDRAHAWENAVNENTGYILQKPLISYRKDVEKAKIPMIIFPPSITNNGMPLLISSVDISYLTKMPNNNKKVSAIEFRHQYKSAGADSLNFLTACRMAATFPYVSPSVNLPGTPTIKTIDAGMIDNFGYSITFKFLNEFRDWIINNTSGVIILNLLEKKYDSDSIPPPPNILLTSSFSSIMRSQHYKFSEELYSLKDKLNNKLYIYDLTVGKKDKEITLSWNLSKEDINLILESLDFPQNRKIAEELKKHLK